mgnify:FL=1
MGLDDFAPATKANSLDEDLFDFPPMEMPAAPQAEADAGPGADSAAGASAGDASAPAAPPAKEPIVCTGLDPELDEDLFGFPPMDLSSLGIVQGKPDIEESIDMAAQQVNNLLEDDLGDIVHEAQAEEMAAESAAQAPGTQAAPAQAASQQAAPVAGQAPAQMIAPAAMQVAYPTVAVASGSPKALWVLTAGVILFMVGILSIAWRATSVFQQQIQAVRSDVEATTNELRVSTTDSIKELAALERELLRNQLDAAKQGRDSQKVYEGLAIQAPHEVVLSVATEAIEAGKFPEARKMLFNLLAEADNHPAAGRDEMERRANFLIARSHKDQAESMTGDKP